MSRLERRLRRDPVERRIKRIVQKLDAEVMAISVEYDTNDRHYAVGWGKDWTVRIEWCERGWREHPSDVLEASGYGHTLTEALDRLEETVNGRLVRRRSEAEAAS